jgi:hypothetical protein
VSDPLVDAASDADQSFSNSPVGSPASSCPSTRARGGGRGARRGSRSARRNGPFATQDDAARAALRNANPRSIRANREYAGLIYRDARGQYYYSGPVRGSDQGANPHSAPAPAGTTVAGDYHTHGDYSTADPATGRAVRTSDPSRDDFNSDNFSATDRSGIASDGAGTPGYRGYLGTPSGSFRSYDPATGTTSRL